MHDPLRDRAERVRSHLPTAPHDDEARLAVLRELADLRRDVRCAHDLDDGFGAGLLDERRRQLGEPVARVRAVAAALHVDEVHVALTPGGDRARERRERRGGGAVVHRDEDPWARALLAGAGAGAGAGAAAGAGAGDEQRPPGAPRQRCGGRAARPRGVVGFGVAADDEQGARAGAVDQGVDHAARPHELGLGRQAARRGERLGLLERLARAVRRQRRDAVRAGLAGVGDGDEAKARRARCEGKRFADRRSAAATGVDRAQDVVQGGAPELCEPVAGEDRHGDQPPSRRGGCSSIVMDGWIGDGPDVPARRFAENPQPTCRRSRMSGGRASASLRGEMQPARPAAVDLFWIPLGEGGHCVAFNGRVFEAVAAARQRRERCDLYHAALTVELEGTRHTIELAPSPDADEASRGVVATGPVGSRNAGRLRLFRYEVRCWRDGSIPDLAWAVGGASRLTSDPAVARRLLDLVALVPRPVWGRDELHAGEMWNSNSMIAWLIAAAGLPADTLRPPPGGRAPGWDAGLEVARRSIGDDFGEAGAAARAPRPWFSAPKPAGAADVATRRRWLAVGMNENNPLQSGALLVFASTHGHTAKIAARLAAAMRDAGIEVDLRDIRQAEDPEPGGYALVVVGGSLHKEDHQKEIVAWAAAHRDALADVPSVFFSVSLSAADDGEEARAATQRCIDDFCTQTGWTPTRTERIAGALQYREYDVFTRQLMRLLMKHMGHPTDASHDYDYTDWEAVDRLGRELAALAVGPVGAAAPVS